MESPLVTLDVGSHVRGACNATCFLAFASSIHVALKTSLR